MYSSIFPFFFRHDVRYFRKQTEAWDIVVGASLFFTVVVAAVFNVNIVVVVVVDISV